MKIMTIAEMPGNTPPKHYDLLGRSLADPSMGAQGFKVSYTHMEKTGRCDPHVHDSAEQLFIVVKGAMMFDVEKEKFLLKQGQAVLVHRGEVHSNYNAAEDGDTDYMTVTG